MLLFLSRFSSFSRLSQFSSFLENRFTKMSDRQMAEAYVTLGARDMRELQKTYNLPAEPKEPKIDVETAFLEGLKLMQRQLYRGYATQRGRDR